MNKPSYEALEIIANACLGALARAGFDMAAMDNPGDAIDSLAKRAATPAPAGAGGDALPAKWRNRAATLCPDSGARHAYQICADELEAAIAQQPAAPSGARSEGV